LSSPASQSDRSPLIGRSSSDVVGGSRSSCSDCTPTGWTRRRGTSAAGGRPRRTATLRPSSGGPGGHVLPLGTSSPADARLNSGSSDDAGVGDVAGVGGAAASTSASSASGSIVGGPVRIDRPGGGAPPGREQPHPQLP